MIGYNRHALVDITPEGRRRILSELVEKGFDRAACVPLLMPEECPEADFPLRGVSSYEPVPGIVRREEFHPRPGFLPVGFTSWTSGPGGRLRLPSFVLPEEVMRSRDPLEVLWDAVESGRDMTRTPALQAIGAMIRAPFPEAFTGVWGSVGMELATGYPYTHERSDLDALLVPQETLSDALLHEWLCRLKELEARFQIRIDAEIRLDCGYGVSLKECARGGARILGKGMQNVCLIDRRTWSVGTE